MNNHAQSLRAMLKFFQQAKNYFCEKKYAEQAPELIEQLATLASANKLVLVINNSEEQLQLLDGLNSWTRTLPQLIEALPLLYQDYSCTRIEKYELENVLNCLNVPADQYVDGTYFALDVGSGISLMFVVLRSLEQGVFDDTDYDCVKNLTDLLAQAVSLSAMTTEGDSLVANLSNYRKRQSIWLESLSWLNDVGSRKYNDKELVEFYNTALFQLKMLVMADTAVAFGIHKETGNLVKIASHEIATLSQYIQSLIEQLISENALKMGAHLKLNAKNNPMLHRLHEDGVLCVDEILIYPLFVREKLRMVLSVGRNTGIFEDQEEVIATLFSEGIVHIIERMYFLRSIQKQNTLLQHEKKEQELLINRLQEAQDQLLQQEKMASIGQLAAGVAHEINNPIGYVNSNLNSLENYITDLYSLLDLYESIEPELPEGNDGITNIKNLKEQIDLDFIRDDISNLIKESKEGIVRVRDIVKDLKDFSHVDELEWQLVNLQSGIISTLNIVSNELKYKAEVVMDFEPLPDVECVPSQVNQVVLNLLVNAGHAIEERGTITIRTRKKDDHFVCIEVQDTGNGIPPEILNKIFNPFFTTKPVGKGTGLGLSLSYSIAERHRGELSVESEVSVGTSFRLTLPIKQPKFDS